MYGPRAPVLTQFMYINELEKMDILLLHLKNEDWRPFMALPTSSDAAWKFIPEIMQQRISQASMEQQVRFANIKHCLRECSQVACALTPDSKHGKLLTSRFSASLGDILSACISLLSMPDSERSESDWNHAGSVATYLWEVQALDPSLATQLFHSSCDSKIISFAFAVWTKVNCRGEPHIHTHSHRTILTGWGCPTVQLFLECLKTDDRRERIFDILLHHPHSHGYRSALIQGAVLRCALLGTPSGECWMEPYDGETSYLDGACAYLRDVMDIVERLSALPFMSLQFLRSSFLQKMLTALIFWISGDDKEDRAADEDGFARIIGLLSRLLTWVDNQEHFGVAHHKEIKSKYRETVNRALMRLLPEFLFEVPVAWDHGGTTYITDVELCIQKLRQRLILAHESARRELWESVRTMPSRYKVGQPHEPRRNKVKHRAAWFQFVKEVLGVGTETSFRDLPKRGTLCNNMRVGQNYRTWIIY